MDTKEALAKAVSEGGEAAIALLALETISKNEAALKFLRERQKKIRALWLVADRWSCDSCVLPECYIVQRFPVLPTEFRRGLAVLAGRASPDVVLTGDEMATAATISLGGEAKRILLVEDNKVNQDVISMQVSMLGHSIELAENGQIGFEKWQTGEFDLMLADCHMPVMDGFKMTGKIREFEKKKNLTRTPIVAITANALQGEVDRCREAGMDDYLSKPVELVRLKKKIDNWLDKVPPVGAEKLKDVPDPKPQALAAVDPSVLVDIVGDDPEMHFNLLKIFVAPSAEIIKDIHDA